MYLPCIQPKCFFMECYATFVFLHFKTHAFFLCFQLTQMAEEDDTDIQAGRFLSRRTGPRTKTWTPKPTSQPALQQSSSIHRKAPRKSRHKAQREVVEVLEDLLKVSDKERKEAAQKVHCLVISVHD